MYKYSQLFSSQFLMHGVQALALDILREHSEHWMFFEKQLTLRAQLYTTPSNLLDQAMISVKCVSMTLFDERWFLMLCV